MTERVKVRAKARRLLDRTIQRVWERTQAADSRTDFELGGITLRLLSLLRRGEPATLDQAAYLAVGMSFDAWRIRSLERQFRQAFELSRCVPDYDPTVDAAGKVGRPPAEPGALYALPKPAQSEEQKPLLRMPNKTEAKKSKLPLAK